MTQLLLISDTHKDRFNLNKVIEKEPNVDGVHVINPGAVSFFGHYAVVTVDKDKLDVELKGVGNPYENILYV